MTGHISYRHSLKTEEHDALQKDFTHLLVEGTFVKRYGMKSSTVVLEKYYEHIKTGSSRLLINSFCPREQTHSTVLMCYTSAVTQRSCSGGVSCLTLNRTSSLTPPAVFHTILM